MDNQNWLMEILEYKYEIYNDQSLFNKYLICDAKIILVTSVFPLRINVLCLISDYVKRIVEHATNQGIFKRLLITDLKIC